MNPISLVVAFLGVIGQESATQEPAALAVEATGELRAAEGARLVRLATGLGFTEGPAADARGDVWFTDQPNDRILRWRHDPDAPHEELAAGSLEVVLEGAARSNGLAFDARGRLLCCAEERNELRAYEPETGAFELLLASFEGRRFNGPNDLWVHPSGAVYFTDPYYQRPWWQRTEPDLPSTDVYRFDPESGTVERAATEFTRPNGIVGSPNGKTLYVADLARDVTWSFPIDEEGELGQRRAVVAMGSDGMALDADGRLYLTGRGVTVVDPGAPGGQRVVGHLAIPESWCANVTFGGADRRTLFITAKGCLYALRMAVEGAR